MGHELGAFADETDIIAMVRILSLATRVPHAQRQLAVNASKSVMRAAMEARTLAVLAIASSSMSSMRKCSLYSLKAPALPDL